MESASPKSRRHRHKLQRWLLRFVLSTTSFEEQPHCRPHKQLKCFQSHLETSATSPERQQVSPPSLNALCIRLYHPDVGRCPADRAVHAHRIHVRKALIDLFQNPVPATSDVERKVMTRVLCKQDIDWDRPILCFKNCRHLEAMLPWPRCASTSRIPWCGRPVNQLIQKLCSTTSEI